MNDLIDNKPRRSRAVPGEKRRDADKVRLPGNMIATDAALRKPAWIRVPLKGGESVARVRRILRERSLSTVCEEAACPNLGECFAGGTATFMVMGEICTRRCSFCDVAHGIPLPLDPAEPARLAEAVAELGLRYVVITSVDRDDLPDAGAGHIASCIAAVRSASPGITVEVLVPDFRHHEEQAIAVLSTISPDVFNHNIETVPRLYPTVRPGARYAGSLALLRDFARAVPAVPTKSGLMLGLGETHDEILLTLEDLRHHGVRWLTLGQYLQPSRDHLPVIEFVTPERFLELEKQARAMGFEQVASGPLVRSSYHADRLAHGAPVR